MNFKKLLTLSAAILMVGTAVGCGPKGPTSEELEQQALSTLTTAAEYIWQMYRNNDNTELTSTFDVVNKVIVETTEVTVNWNVEITGSKDAYSFTKKDENFSTLKVGYYDGLVKEESSVKMVPTFTLGEKSITLADVYADDTARHAIDLKTPVLVLNTHEDWDKAADGDSITVKGTVVDVISKESGSSSAGSLYMVDEQGNGYYIYKPTSTGAKAGDLIIATGAKTIYNGQEETKSGGSYQVIGKGATIPVVNASADFAAATSNKVDGELANKYQNIPVKLEKCTPVKVDGSYYWFTVGDGTTQFNIYNNNYFLNEEQIEAWKALFTDALEKGYTFTVEGISTVYSKAYQIYPSSIAPHVLTKEAELTVDEKHEVVKNALVGAVKASYSAEAEIAFAVPSYAEVTLAVTAPATGATVSVKDGKIKVAPTSVATENKVTATVKIGESTKTVELTINTAAVRYDGYKVVVGVNDMGLGETASTQTKTFKAKSFEGQEVDVTVKATNLFVKYNATYMSKGVADDIYTISAPEGYVIDSIEVDGYGTFDNINFHAGQDATGTALEETFVKDSENNKGHYTIVPNVQHVTIDNPQDGFNGSFYDVTVIVKEAPASETPVAKTCTLTPSNLLAGEGEKDKYVTEPTTATIDGLGLEFLQMANYASDGLRMRVKDGTQAYLKTTTAIETGIKSVSFSILDSKNTYTNTAYMTFDFSNNADFSNSESIVLDTTKGTYDYTITPSVTTYKYVRITYTCTAGTCYMDAITINY